MPTVQPFPSLDAFQDFLDQFGENPAAWPEGQRDIAQATLDASSEARDVLAAAAALHGQLRRRDVKAPAHLRRALDRFVVAEGGAAATPVRRAGGTGRA
jgi:hypothetical protein